MVRSLSSLGSAYVLEEDEDEYLVVPAVANMSSCETMETITWQDLEIELGDLFSSMEHNSAHC